MTHSDHDIADIVRQFSGEYSIQFGERMLPSQKKAILDIAICQTADCGGRRFQCADCEHSFWMYYGCKNRSCPKCHGGQIAAWLAEREVEMLPCPYFHLIATVPESLRPLFLKHQKSLYGLLMKTVSRCVIDIVRQDRFIGATPAILTVLHTWNGRLEFHPHVHLLVSAGGVSDDGQEWRECKASFLLPVKLLSKRIAVALKAVIEKERPDLAATIDKKVWKENWCTFCVPYGRGEKAVLNYLGRYVFRTAITNNRIVAVTETHVSFRYKDRKAGTMKTETVSGMEFLRRYLLHVLPKGFHKVRYYGLWHSSKQPEQLAAKVLLVFRKPTGAEPMLLTSGIPPLEPLEEVVRYGERCPKCGSEHLALMEERPRTRLPWNRPEVFEYMKEASRGDP
jgi:hypothetical protein